MKFLETMFGKKNKSLEELSITDLEHSKILLSEEERRLAVQIEQKEKNKTTLFSQGVEAGSQYQKLSLARKVKELDDEIKGFGVRMARVSQRTRVLNRIIEIKRSQTKPDVNDPVWGAIKDISPDQLEKIITTEQGSIIADDTKLADLLTILDVGSADFNLKEDEETMRILQAMENAGETSNISHELEAPHADYAAGKEKHQESSL